MTQGTSAPATSAVGISYPLLHGFRRWDGAEVLIKESSGRGLPLPLRIDLMAHSPTGPDWGHGGAGAQQLALAALAWATGDDVFALGHYQRFKWDVVAQLPDHGFRLSRQQILEWVATHASANAAGPATQGGAA